MIASYLLVIDTGQIRSKQMKVSDHFQQAAQTHSSAQCSDILLLHGLGEMLFTTLTEYLCGTLTTG